MKIVMLLAFAASLVMIPSTIAGDKIRGKITPTISSKPAPIIIKPPPKPCPPPRPIKKTTVVVVNKTCQTTSFRGNINGNLEAQNVNAAKYLARTWFQNRFGCGPESVLPGSFVDSLPWLAGSKIGGISYFKYGGVFFTPVPGGYVVTTPPSVLPQQVTVQESLPYELRNR